MYGWSGKSKSDDNFNTGSDNSLVGHVVTVNVRHTTVIMYSTWKLIPAWHEFQSCVKLRCVLTLMSERKRTGLFTHDNKVAMRELQRPTSLSERRHVSTERETWMVTHRPEAIHFAAKANVTTFRQKTWHCARPCSTVTCNRDTCLHWSCAHSTPMAARGRGIRQRRAYETKRHGTLVWHTFISPDKYHNSAKIFPHIARLPW